MDQMKKDMESMIDLVDKWEEACRLSEELRNKGIAFNEPSADNPGIRGADERLEPLDLGEADLAVLHFPLALSNLEFRMSSGHGSPLFMCRRARPLQCCHS